MAQRVGLFFLPPQLAHFQNHTASTGKIVWTAKLITCGHKTSGNRRSRYCMTSIGEDEPIAGEVVDRLRTGNSRHLYLLFRFNIFY